MWLLLLALSLFQGSQITGPAKMVGPGVVAASISGGSALFHETFTNGINCGSGLGNNCDNTWYFMQNAITFATGSATLSTSGAMDAGAPGINFADQNTAWLSSEITLSNLSDYPILNFGTDAASTLCTVHTFNATTVYVTQAGGTQQSLTVATMSAGTPYFFKLRYNIGMGANALCDGWFSTDGTTWQAVPPSTDGTSTSQLGLILYAQPSGQTMKVQNVCVSTADILNGTSCP